MLTQAREDLIERTAESLVGAKTATIHMYNATAPLFRRVVFRVDKAECIALATRGTELVMKYAEQHLGDVEFGYQYSPEIFTGTELEFAVEVCNAVMDVWQPGAGPGDHPQPAGHGGDVPRRTRTPTRSSGSAGTSATASTWPSRCTRTTTAAPRPRRPSWP